MASPKLGECYTARAEAGGRRVFLKVKYAQTGWVLQVLETDGNTEVACELANDPHNLAAAKGQAEEIACGYIGDKDLKMPKFEWKEVQ